jgi:hypothetical protein
MFMSERSQCGNDNMRFHLAMIFRVLSYCQWKRMAERVASKADTIRFRDNLRYSSLLEHRHRRHRADHCHRGPQQHHSCRRGELPRPGERLESTGTAGHSSQCRRLRTSSRAPSAKHRARRSKSVAAGIVLSETPASGTLRATGSHVALIVSRGSM